MEACREAGLLIYGINAEVMPGQWEFQIGYRGFEGDKNDALQITDDVWYATWLLNRLAEDYDISVSYDNKPIKGDWNGSGMHANFSDTTLRTCGDEKIFQKVCESFGRNIEKHISVYGADNDQRLTGAHETQSINEFSYGVSDRGASIRIPIMTVENGWKGWLEDRRPSSNADPYKISGRIIKTVKEAKI